MEAALLVHLADPSPVVALMKPMGNVWLYSVSSLCLMIQQGLAFRLQGCVGKKTYTYIFILGLSLIHI